MYMYVPEVLWARPPRDLYRAVWHDFSDVEWKEVKRSKWFDSEFEADQFIERIRKLYPTCEFWLEVRKKDVE